MTAGDARRTWDAMAAGWDRRRAWLAGVARPVERHLLGLLAPEPGARVLELAGGAGDLALALAEAVGDGGRVIYSDFSPAMVEAARAEAERRGARNVEHRVIDATAIDLADASVDGVLCRWGYMLFPDPAGALRETRRVLRPGGRVALSVWAAPDANAWGAVPARALVQQAGWAPPGPDEPGLFALADPARLRALVEGAGLRVEALEDVEVEWTFAGFDDFWSFVLELAGALAAVIDGLAPERRDAVREATRAGLERYGDGDGGYAIPGRCLDALAVVA
jgi:SAM-dependent methyltransferase